MLGFRVSFCLSKKILGFEEARQKRNKAHVIYRRLSSQRIDNLKWAGKQVRALLLVEGTSCALVHVQGTSYVQPSELLINTCNWFVKV